MPFKFKKSQCVMVPGIEGVQGRIAARTDFVTQPNEYSVTWLDEKLDLQSKTFPEDALAETQAPIVEGVSVGYDRGLPEVDFSNAQNAAFTGKRMPRADRPKRKRTVKKRSKRK